MIEVNTYCDKCPTTHHYTYTRFRQYTEFFVDERCLPDNWDVFCSPDTFGLYGEELILCPECTRKQFEFYGDEND